MRPIILTVDDAKAVRDLVEKVMQPFDCEVTSATNGYNAFFAIEKARPQLILLDISMPVMDGIETLSRLKGAPEIADIPVIMLTSRADHRIVPELPALGAKDTLMKPFTEASLLEKIRGAIPLKQRGTNPN